MANFDDLQGAVAQFGAGNKVIYDDIGMPSIMYGVPKMTYKDIITGGTDEVLPFFIVDGVEKNTIWVSKFQNIVEQGRAYSLAMKLPKNWISYDHAIATCRAKGNGWHLNQTGIFNVLAMISYKAGTSPHGNNNSGEEISATYEKGIKIPNEECLTLTGSGPATWYHNHGTSGVADLNGNVWEWTGGARLYNGEYQVIPFGNSMKNDCDISENSTLWKAIMPDGTLVEHGTNGTLNIDGTKITVSAGTNETDGNFKDISSASGVNIPQLFKALGFYPDSAISYGNDYFCNTPKGECLPLRGAGFWNGLGAGISALHLSDKRTATDGSIGFRSAYCEL